MASATPNTYYDGSRLLSPISDVVGVAVDQMNFVSSQLLALGLAALFRTHLHSSKTSAELRQGFSLIVGLFIGYFCFGIQAIHLAGLPSICYLVIRTLNPQIMQRVVMAVALLYLSIIHIHRQVYDYGSYTLDITGPLMIIMQKITSLAFSLHDGLAKKDEDLSPSQKFYAIKRIPTPLEYFSYALQFQTLMAGPTVFYNDYVIFMEGKNFKLTSSNGDVDKNSNSKNIPAIEPSPMEAVSKKLLGAIMCAVLFIKLLPLFPIETVKMDWFVEDTTLFYKFYYLIIATTLVRFKYYHAWLFADAICNNSGWGFNGYDGNGRAKWDQMSNIDIWKFEVEIVDSRIQKPFLGGYYHKVNGYDYHHAYSQTGPPDPKVPHYMKNHRDTQTYYMRNRLLTTSYARATQMSSTETWIPTGNDKILSPKPYITADELAKTTMNKDEAVRTIQRYFWRWRLNKALKVLCAEYRRRKAAMEEAEQLFWKDDEDRKKTEINCKIFPRTKEEFCMLYAMVDRWKTAEMQRIDAASTKASKIAAFYMLLEKEIQMLKCIENHRKEVAKDVDVQKEIDFFKAIAEPLHWDNRYTDWTGKRIDLNISMDTLETQRGRDFKNLYLTIRDDRVSRDDRIEALMSLKALLQQHNCETTSELVRLLDRECELLVRDVKSTQLGGLRNRIRGLLLHHFQSEEPMCGEHVTDRMKRVKEKLMEKNLIFCKRCCKYKLIKEFNVHSRTEELRVCATCQMNDRVEEPWIDIAPYRYMLRQIRRDERQKSCESSVIFILQEKDIHYLVIKIWHGHSVLSESDDLYTLRLCRWYVNEDWAPWNCALMTYDEAKAHSKIKNLEEIYSAEFLRKIYHYHMLAKEHFYVALEHDRRLQEPDETTGEPKWKGIVEYFGASMRESIDGWNIGTNRWLRMIVYERVKKNGTLLTYALSAVWHGFYPGYYMTFASGALFTFASRNVRRSIRPYFTETASMKQFYDFITILTTRLVFGYITFTFVLLEFWPGVRLYLHMYMCLHIMGLLALFVLPQIVPKASKHRNQSDSNDAKKLKELIENKSSITNGFSKHID